ncbi:hypothetical protein OEZ86_000833 [Tetradesmus obliquus]|nr:hypothetical protein OEZ86_000833 [Tetradesmus obliquus]
MDFSVKQAARSKHKHTQHLKRVHGGRGRGRGGSGSAARTGPELDSNYDRYGISDDEAAADAEAQVLRQSEGADLEQLLAESEQFYAQAHFRYRSFLDTVDPEPPPVDVAALEQELALQVEPLVQALALLPPAELLGIDPQFLLACDPANDLAGSGASRPAAAAAAAAAVGDDADEDLDELLGLCGAAQKPANTQATGQSAAGQPAASKKQSLEEWLDGF